MTKLTSENTVTRETAIVYKGKPLVVGLHPGYLTIRPKGGHEEVMLAYDAAYETALKIEAREKRSGR